MVRNILITGGAGYIGSHTAEILIKNKKKVYIVDNLSTGFKKLIIKKTKFFKTDILKKDKINKIINQNNIDSVIHLAAVLSVGESERNPGKYNRINFDGTKKLLAAIKNTKVKNFIFSSTCAVYKDGFTKVTEKTKVDPTSVYGKTKLKCEKIIKNFCKKNKLNYGILRYFNVAGASASGKIGQINKGDQLFKNLSLEVQKKKPIFKIYGTKYKTKDGTCIRDYMHVTDLSVTHIKSLEYINNNSKSITLNCGYGKGYSVLDIVKIFKKIKKNLTINITAKRKGDVESVYADTRKLKKILKIKMQYNNISKILKSSIKWESIVKNRN